MFGIVGELIRQSWCLRLAAYFQNKQKQGTYHRVCSVMEASLLVPVSPLVRFEGGEKFVFLSGQFLKNLGLLPLRRCVSFRFHVFLGARPPVHFGDRELTGAKNRLPKSTLLGFFVLY